MCSPGMGVPVVLYDENGNRVDANDEAHTNMANNRLNTDGEFNYEYDNEGNLTSRTSQSNSSHTDYTWDNGNRLTQIQQYDSAGSLAKTITYRYNNDDLRVRKQVDVAGTSTGDTIEHYVYDGSQLVLTLGNTGIPKHRYTNGVGVDSLLVDEVFAAGEVDKTLWAANDHQGSVRELLATDANHTVVEHRDYDPFGELDVLYDQSGAQKSGTVALDSVFAFAGREWDEEAQLYYNRARYYDPNTARFLGEDPALSDPNLYRYAGNDPVNFRDPSGLFSQDAFYGGYWYEAPSSFSTGELEFDGGFLDGTAGMQLDVGALLGNIQNPSGWRTRSEPIGSYYDNSYGNFGSDLFRSGSSSAAALPPAGDVLGFVPGNAISNSFSLKGSSNFQLSFGAFYDYDLLSLSSSSLIDPTFSLAGSLEYELSLGGSWDNRFDAPSYWGGSSSRLNSDMPSSMITGHMYVDIQVNFDDSPVANPVATATPSASSPSFLQNVWRGAVYGDFAENTGWGGVLGATAAGFIPIAGQVADVRDTIAAVKEFGNGGWKNWGTYANLAAVAIAWVPGFDGVKGGKNAIKESVQSSARETAQRLAPKTTPHTIARGGNKTAGAPKTGTPDSIHEQIRPNGSRSVTYYDGKGRAVSREDYGQQRTHGVLGRGPDGLSVPHEHRVDFSDRGPIGKLYRELDLNGKPVGPWHNE